MKKQLVKETELSSFFQVSEEVIDFKLTNIGRVGDRVQEFSWGRYRDPGNNEMYIDHWKECRQCGHYHHFSCLWLSHKRQSASDWNRSQETPIGRTSFAKSTHTNQVPSERIIT